MAKALETNLETGISHDRAMYLYTLNGPNRLTPPKQNSKILKLLKELFSGISLILILGSIFCIFSYILSSYNDPEADKENLYLGIILICVVIFSATFNFVYETKSLKILESFNKLLPLETMVLRDKEKMMIKCEEVVKGDIVLLHGGDMVPADLRIIKSNCLKIDNSSLTGESEPQTKKPGISNKRYLEADNMAFAYTYVIEGTCVGIAVATGDNTVMGKIAELTASLETEPSTLSLEIKYFIKIITIIAFLIGGVSFILSIIISKSGFLNSFIFLIGMIVANVPEGLGVTVTLCLALTAKRLASKNCLIKNLESIETLGCTNVICSDKTGTLTQNKMTVSHIWKNNEMHEFTKFDSVSPKSPPGNQPLLEEYLHYITILCNRSHFKDSQNFKLPVNELSMFGNSTDCALLRYSQIEIGSVQDVRNKFKKIHDIPFNSHTKFQFSVFEKIESGQFFLCLKGAPERILKFCNRIMINENFKTLENEDLHNFKEAYTFMGNNGERVIATAFQILSKDEYSLIDSEKIIVFFV